MKILVSGAGVAGLASAINLGTRGHDVTVVEYGRDLRFSGSPIDIRGDALGIAARMGLLTTIRPQRIGTTELAQFVAADGRPVAAAPTEEASGSPAGVEIARADTTR